MTIALFLKIYEVTENVTIEPHHCLSRNCFFSIHTFLYYFYSVNFLAFFFYLGWVLLQHSLLITQKQERCCPNKNCDGTGL
jgi:hypothetical protein